MCNFFLLKTEYFREYIVATLDTDIPQGVAVVCFIICLFVQCHDSTNSMMYSLWYLCSGYFPLVFLFHLGFIIDALEPTFWSKFVLSPLVQLGFTLYHWMSRWLGGCYQNSGNWHFCPSISQGLVAWKFPLHLLLSVQFGVCRQSAKPPRMHVILFLSLAS